MWQVLVKVLLTSAVVVAVSEIARRSTFWASVLASLPLTSVLAFVWLYVDSSDANRVADVSRGVFWLVLPSIPMFPIIALLIRLGWGFWASLATACVVTAMLYLGMLWLLGRVGLRF